MNVDEIKKRMAVLSQCSKEIEEEVAELRAQCPHPEFVEGLTIIGCIQPILICKVCGKGKPINEKGDFGSFTVG